MERGIGYVRLSGDSLEFWRQAMRHSPVSFRWFGRSLNPDDLAEELSGREQWRIAMEQYQAGDKIWPFIINPNTLAMRLGYIIVRDGKPVTGVVTLVS